MLSLPCLCCRYTIPYHEMWSHVVLWFHAMLLCCAMGLPSSIFKWPYLTVWLSGHAAYDTSLSQTLESTTVPQQQSSRSTNERCALDWRHCSLHDAYTMPARCLHDALAAGAPDGSSSAPSLL